MNDEDLLPPLDERSGPALRISNARASSMVDAALEQALVALETPPARAIERRGLGGLVARFASLRGPVRALAVAASVLLVLVGGAAAAKLIAEKLFEPRTEAPAPSAPPQSGKRALPSAPPAPSAVPDEPTEVALEAETEATPRRARKSSERAGAAEPSAPEDLLQRANRARAAGEFADAAAIYAEVYERYPRSMSAYVAQVAAGSIELEHLGRPERARRLFLHALRAQPKGALDLEARQGLAIALRDLGEREQEARALRALIDAHPSRPAARRALIRLRELGQAELAP